MGSIFKKKEVKEVKDEDRKINIGDEVRIYGDPENRTFIVTDILLGLRGSYYKIEKMVGGGITSVFPPMDLVIKVK